MRTVQGKHAEAKVFTDDIDELALEQIKRMCDQEFAKGSRIRIMPDVHPGAGCTIGTTMTIRDTVVPNLVGVDIGCGMETVRVKQKKLDFEKLDELIRKRIPSGFAIRESAHPNAELVDLSGIRAAKGINRMRAARSLGTLGGGNHFIEADRDEEGNLYIVIHSGSRHLGLETAQYYQHAAWEELNGRGDEEVASLIAGLKAEGRGKEIEAAIKRVRTRTRIDIPRDLAYLSGRLFHDYIHDMKIVQGFADQNRKAMMEEIVHGMGLNIEEAFTTVHNYIDTEAMILRKGAVAAGEGQILLIPINMRDGSLICRGKGNPDWNCSAPHGAGRIHSRGKAMQLFTLKEFKESMKGIFTTSVRKDTIDECPMAYKSMKSIEQNIGPTAEIVKRIVPVYNFKAAGD